MSYLATGLASVDTAGIDWVLSQMGAASVNIFDEGYDMLIPAVAEAYTDVGEIYAAQLALARKLAGVLNSASAYQAKESLKIILGGTRDRFRWERRFAATPTMLAGTPQIFRGAHWRLEMKTDAAKISLPPPFDPPETLKEVQGRIFYQGGETESGFEDFFIEKWFPKIVVGPIPKNAVAIHMGGRDSQQDYTLSFDGTLLSGLPLKIRIVADGHWPEGAEASRLAAWLFLKRLAELLILYPSAFVSDAITEAIRYADTKILNNHPRGGTTFVAFVQAGSQKYLANVGDSRGYFLSDAGEQTKITIDHSIKMSDGLNHFLRVLGEKPAREDYPFVLSEPDIFVPTLEGAGLLVLASDGIRTRAVFEERNKMKLEVIANAIIQDTQACYTALRYTDNMTVNLTQLSAD